MSPRSRIGSVLLASLFFISTAYSQGLAKLDASLKDIPADAAYYSTLLRNKEQLDLFLNSKAWAKLTSQPTLGQFYALIDLQLRQPGGPFDRLEQFQKDPENKQLVDLLVDMVSSEIFIYGGPTWSEVSGLFQELQGVSGFLQGMSQGFAAGRRGGDTNELQLRIFLRALAKQPERVQIPELVIGFKVRDSKSATAQLARLEKLLLAQAEQVPEMKGRIKRQQLGGGDYLTLSLDGKIIPWEQIPFENLEEKPGEFKPLVQRLKTLTMTVSLGVRNNHVLLAIGGTTEHLTKFGQGKKLIDQPELQPLVKYADRKLTHISYVSKSMMTANTAAWNLDGLADGAAELLKQFELTPEQIARIRKDLNGISKDIKARLPEPGAAMSFSFLNGRGYEGYSYDWSKNSSVDGTKPLTLLNHLGDSPLFAYVGRSKTSPEEWNTFVRWLKVAHGYFEEFGLPKMSPQERDQYEQAKKGFLPALKRFDSAMTQLIIPGLADGQAGIVIDAKLTSKSWFGLPPSAKPLPMLEAGLVLGVSDADKLVKGGSELRAVSNMMLAEVRKFDKKKEIPPFEIPPPQEKALKVGKSYFWPLPQNLNLDPRIQPNAGVADRVAALTLSLEHTERLMTPTELKVTGGPLANTRRPMLSALRFDWAGCIDALKPWVDYGLSMAPPTVPAEEIHVVLDFLKCFRSCTTASYLEGAASVTHSEVVIEDLK